MTVAILVGEFLQEKPRVPLLVIVSSAFLPYGVVTTDTAGMSINQFWLFPFWMYLHDFGNWLGFGVIIPPFVPAFPLPLLFLGLLWIMLDFYICRVLHRFYAGQIKAKAAWLSTLGVLAFQTIMTAFIVFISMSDWIILVIPLPIHTLIVIVLLKVEIRRVEGNPVSWWPGSSQT
ncbi:MAG: hypothetical protein KAU48_09705 [Candidatus Thorarchaeota archaeon]|nr:hypothetical protein [Candidatus Thorarchaeota archaeon]